MADIFLIALYIILIKGVGLARVETAWGLYFYTGCVLLSLAISLMFSLKPRELHGRARPQQSRTEGD